MKRVLHFAAKMNRRPLLIFLLTLFISMPFFTFAQDRSVTGTVQDENGAPLSSVSVTIIGKSLGTVTDNKGKFSIRISKGDTLIFSLVNYLEEKFATSDFNDYSVVLAKHSGELDKVVVVGYGSTRKKDLTGSVAVVSAKDIENIPATNPLQALQGKASGVQITSGSGQPGAAMQVRIRGISSWNGGSLDPLFVVDGVITNNLNAVNPEDIESVSVLKDASSAAIYGSRAANGVVLVTTKRGKRTGFPTINFHTYLGVQRPSNLKIKMLNAAQYLELDRESYGNIVAGNPYPTDPAEYDKLINDNYGGVDEDWLKVISRTGTLNYADISINGGNERSTYFTSMSYVKHKGVTLGTGASKLNLRLNTDHKIRNFLEFGNSLNLYYNTYEGFPDLSGVPGIPNPSGVAFNPYTQAMIKPSIARAWESDGSYGYIRNAAIEGKDLPAHLIANEFTNKSVDYGAIGNLYLRFKLLDGLTFTPRLSVDYNTFRNTQFGPSTNIRGAANASTNHTAKATSYNFHWIADYMLNYEKKFNDMHRVGALLVYSQEENMFEDLGGGRTSSPSDIPYLGAGDVSTATNFNTASSWSFISYTGRLNYSFMDKYYLQATVRRDGSSRFGKDNRWGVFPSYSLAWSISQEDFFHRIKPYVNTARLRLGMGTLGNAAIGNYAGYSTISNYNYVLNGVLVPAATLDGASNSAIKWETTKKYDVGLDLTFLDSRLNLTFNYYLAKTSGLLYQKKAPLSSGLDRYKYPIVNGGSLENEGIEIELGFTETTGDIQYAISGNLSANRNKVTDLAGQDLRTSQNLEVGQPVNYFFGYKALGIIKDQKTLDNYPHKVNAQSGDIWIEDVNKDGRIDEADRTVIGRKYPDFTYGFTGNVSWKGFTFMVSAYGVQGVDLDSRGADLDYFQYPQNNNARVLNRWHATKNPNGNLPRVTRSDAAGNISSLSTIWLSNASYFRINNVNLSYTLPVRFLKYIQATKLDVYMSVNNLYTFTNYSGQEVDVAVGTGQFDFANNKIPQPRTISWGIKLSF